SGTFACFRSNPVANAEIDLEIPGNGRKTSLVFFKLTSTLSQPLDQMETPRAGRSARTTPTTCNVPELLVGFTKLCKLTKVCAAPDLDNDEAATTKYGYDQRLILIRLFEAMATLKPAYIKLQRAHFPYDPAKIAFADELITSELDSVTALQCLCNSKSGSSIGVLINERWALVQELEAEVRRRDSDIALMKRELERLQRENAKLNKQVQSQKLSVKQHYDKCFTAPKKELATTTSGEVVELFKAASTSLHEFAGLIASSLASSDRCGWNRAPEAEQSRTRYSLEAHLSRTMICGGTGRRRNGEEEFHAAHHFDRIMRSCDPLDALMQYPSSSFSRFCQTKYLSAVPSEMEAAMFRNLEQRAFVSRGGHPRTWFYRAFATMARSAWALRVAMAKYGASAGPNVRMFYARRGREYQEEFMESVNEPVAGRREENISVAFTVTPGLKISDTVVIACRVFSCHPEHITPSVFSD
ncbi:hypothetical protein EJB05_29879, partial [Eragrostis curvula]